ncbi:hypothetical protein PDE_02133 [Penicillium oxalicum 114-2]|uniref:FAD/NAD(P)-binding domain-containing protein n=1 Tax=Penicillium oxalicum (strain 114-2 / CGMCC 5302) TaxID=933388 RepID=S7Z994_PENO1|nr:hypothetical protein PDE_02133 [Penicillium oxalicum 114-2]
MQEITDAFIVGGGPAGLGAALGLCRQNHSVVLFDSASYRNSSSNVSDLRMHMVLTWDHQRPDDFRAAARSELQRYERFQYVPAEVRSVQQTMRTVSGGRSELVFVAVLADGKEWIARKVILATGVKDIFPKIEGFAESWARGIFHCLFCHGFEERNAESVGVLAVDECADMPTALRIARAAHQFSESVTIYTNGNAQLGARLAQKVAKDKWCRVNKLSIKRLVALETTASSPAAMELEFTDGTVQKEHFIVHKPRTQQASAIPAQLGLEMTPDADIKVVGMMFETSMHGVFAVGDCASPHKFVSYATIAGGFAAAGAATQLQAGY